NAGNRGSRSAVANLIGAYADNAAAHPEESGKVPLIELATDSYKSQHGKQIYVPTFEILKWVERPDAVRRILPPPIKMLDLAALPAPAPTAIPIQQPVESSDMSEEIPF